ncbi:MAG: hypothetical protein GXO85_15040 [Chlorobi bacterium]|nr:hypothetical protein [Chlorobiota bacterium]
MSFDKDQIRPVVPEPEYDDPKEIYAFFGLAAYSVQLLEQGILNLLVGVRISAIEGPTWGNVRDLYNEGDRKTLGQLFKALQKLVKFDTSIEEHLADALQKRNYLIHHFFVEHAKDLLSESGKRKMIDELCCIIGLFKMVDPQVDQLWHAIWGKYGFTKKRIERELKILKDKLKREEERT